MQILVLKHRSLQFVRVHTRSLINIKNLLNRPITKFHNNDDVNMIEAERVTAH